MSTSSTGVRPPGARHRARRHRPGRLGRRAFTCWSALALALATPVASAAPAQAATPMYLGAAGNVQQLSQQTGQPLATHAYAQFSNQVPQGRMLTVRTSASWKQVAAAQPGSALYADILRWAQTVKGRPGPILLAYHHEPEASGSNGAGSPADFVSAYRRVVSIFRAQGVTNVQFTWQMTAYAFRVPASDGRAAARWYPGDAYVDVVAADAYNWADCGKGSGRWEELSTLTDPVIAFARAHGKKAALAEFASDPGARRAQWLTDAHKYLAAHVDVLTAAFYFNRGPTNGQNMDCSWTLTTRPEFTAFGDMARDTSRFRT
ncbi:MAG: domain containing protein [Modestobacter sp.]|jgi:beta-mannanase|nr:domain containing protein [Modestobacter sp.]